jgi:hypothetical protein
MKSKSTFANLLAASCVIATAVLLGGVLESSRKRHAPSDSYEARLGDFWAHRVSYPTGVFSYQWLVQAKVQADLIPAATPAGTFTASKSSRAKSLDPSRFTELGPSPLVDSSGTNPATQRYAGRVNVIVTHPSNPAIAWLGSDGGGVWKTNNCCSSDTTWRNTSDDAAIQVSAIGDLSIDPNNPNVLYAGTGDLRFGSYSFGSNGVLKSIDGGESWSVEGESVFNPFYSGSANQFPQYQAIGKIRVDPNNSDRLVVGTKTGLFLSYDAGESWAGPCLSNPHTTQRQDVTGLELIRIGTSTQMIVAIGTRAFETPVQPNLNQNGANGLYRASVPQSGCPADFQLLSTAGNGWPIGTGSGIPISERNTNLNANTLGRIDIAIAPSNPNVIYAQVARPNFTTPDLLGVWRSSNGGLSWQQRSANNTAYGTQSWYNAGLSVSPTNPEFVILSSLRSFRSTNGAITFSAMSTSTHADHHARAFVGNDPNKMLLGTDGGVYYTSNLNAEAPTWTALNESLNTIEFYAGTISENFATAESAIALGGAQDNGTMASTWSAQNQFEPQAWEALFGGDGISNSIEPIFGRRWYYSSQNGNMVLSTAGQSRNTQRAAPAGWTDDRKSFLTQFDLYRFGAEGSGCPAATGCERVLAGSFRAWESTSGGIPTTSYVANSPDLTKNTLADRSVINKIRYAYSTPNQAIAGTNDGNVWLGFELGRTAENPVQFARWVNLTDSNTVLPNRPIMDITTDAKNPLVGYAVAGGFDQNTPAQPGHVFRYVCAPDCSSFSWRNISGNLPNIPFNAVMINPNRPNQLFAGSDWGLYFTDDASAANVQWRKHAGLPNVMIWDLSIDRGATTLAAWTRSRGAWVWPLPKADPNAGFSTLSGAFYNTQQSGHGFFFEVLEQYGAPVLLANWYVYRDGLPLWLVGSGPLIRDDAGKISATIQSYQGRSAQFPPLFVSSQAQASLWGTLNLEFIDNDRVTLNWNGVDGIGSMPLQRLSYLAAGAQITGNLLGRCHSANWYQPAQSGHGWQLEILDPISAGGPKRALLLWFVYQGGQPTWLIGSGDVDASLRFVDLSVIQTRGAQFPPLFDTTAVQQIAWGTMRFEALDFNRATISWQSTQPGYSNGSMDVERLSQLIDCR